MSPGLRAGCENKLVQVDDQREIVVIGDAFGNHANRRILVVVWSFQYNATHRSNVQDAGHFVKAHTSVDDSDVVVGNGGINGRSGVFLTGGDRVTLVTTDKQVIAVKGEFSAPSGAALRGRRQ